MRESCRLAADSWTASGIPWRSTIKRYLEPSFPRSVGFRPVASPLFGLDSPSVQASAFPVDPTLVAQPVQDHPKEPLSHPGVLPLAGPPPTGRPAPVAKLCREALPRNPVSSTKMIPPNAARSETHGRPPCGCSARRGKSGSIASRDSSLTFGFCPMTPDYGQLRTGCETLSKYPPEDQKGAARYGCTGAALLIATMAKKSSTDLQHFASNIATTSA